jgi:hypothetical protein
MVCWNLSTFPWVCGWLGLPFFWGDAEAAQLVLEAVAAALAAGQAGGEDHAVVGQGRGRDAVHPARSAEGQQHDRPGNPGMGGDGQGVAGVVIEPGQDLGVRAVGERVVGEVGLPALVRHVCLEPDVGRLRPLGRAGGDQSGPAQVPADGRSRHVELVVVLQVPGDGLRPGVQALPGQFLAQPDDQVGRLVADRGRGGLRPPGPRLERCHALGLVAVQQRVDPGASDPVSPRDLADRALLDSDGGDDQPGFRHPGSVQPTGPSPGEGTPLIVLDVLRHPVLDVLNLDTTPATP